MKIGENIKNARYKKGMSQAELAQAIGSTKSTISKYELGHREPSFETLKKISQTLNISVNELLEIQPLPKENIKYGVGREGELDNEDIELLAFDQYLNDLGYFAYMDLALFTEDERPWVIYDKREDIFYRAETKHLNTLSDNINAFAKFQIHELLCKLEKITDLEVRNRYNRKYKKKE